MSGYVALVHWHEAEARERAERLTALGYRVATHWRSDAGGELTRMLRAQPPLALVVDLGRLPSHGRAVITWLRERKALRRIPVVVVPGDTEKTERVRATFPDAVYASWGRMKAALSRAIRNPPSDPVVPLAPDYSGTPLAKKLGLRPGSLWTAVRAPRGFATTLGDLPEGCQHRRGLRGQRDVVLLFCRALAELRRDWPTAVTCLAPAGALWVVWPKKSAGAVTDLSSDTVRAFGLDQGLVDTKVCAIDRTWSALRFSRRRAANR